MASKSKEELKTFEELLDQKPSLAEVCEYGRTNKWWQLGVQLELDEIDLEEINEDKNRVDDKRTSLYQLWFRTQPKATRRQLLTALKSAAVGECNRIAKGYEDMLRRRALPYEEDTSDQTVVTLLDTRISDIHIASIGREIIHWEDIPLGITQSDIEEIKQNNPNDYNQQKVECLYKWRQKDIKGTYRQLINIVYPISRELAEHIASLIRVDINAVIDRETLSLISLYDWDEPIDDEMIRKIGHAMVSWEELSISLGLIRSERVVIKKDYSGDYSAQKRQVLFKWREKQGQSIATYRTLVKILTEIEDTNLVDYITEFIKK